jgi:hypothetical protein
VFRAGNSIDGFKNAFRHVSSLFRNSGANFNIQIAYNSANARDIQTPFRDFYPGDEFVDQVHNGFQRSKTVNNGRNLYNVRVAAVVLHSHPYSYIGLRTRLHEQSSQNLLDM